MKRFFLVIFILKLATLQTFSQFTPVNNAPIKANFKRYSLEQGLLSRYVFCIFQDKLGYIWVGTSLGLSRFDGTRCINFTLGNSSLPHYAIHKIYEGPDAAHISVKSGSEVVFLNIYTLQIVSFEKYWGINKRFSAPVNSWCRGTKGEIYFAQQGIGLSRLRGKDAELLVSQKTLGTYGEIRYLFSLKDGGISANSAFGEYRKWNDHTLFRCTVPGLKMEAISTIAPSADDIELFQVFPNTGPKDGFLYLDNCDKKNPLLPGEPPLLPEVRANSSEIKIFAEEATLSNKIFWILGTGNYLWRYETNGGLQELGAPLRERPSSSSIYQIFRDRTSLYWIATDDGLFSMQLKKTNMNTWLNKAPKGSNNSLRQMERWGDQLFVCGDEQMKVINLNTGTESPFESVFPWMAHEKNARAILMEDNKRLWVGGSAAFVYDLKTHERKIYRYNKIGAIAHGSTITWCFFSAGGNRMLAGVDDGLYYLNPGEDDFRNVGTLHGATFLDSARINFICSAGSGDFWIATEKGLVRWNFETGIQKWFRKQAGLSNFIPENAVTHVYCRKDGMLWLSTRTGGIIRLNPVTGVYRQYTMDDGLSNNTNYAIYEDAKGMFWIPSNFGLMHFDPVKGSVRNYLPDEITHEEFNSSSHFRDSQGNLYFGGLNGMVSFHPDSIINITAPDPLKIVVSGLNQLNPETGEMQVQTIGWKEGQEIELPYGGRAFELSLFIPDFRTSDNNLYAYRILELNQNWTYQKENKIRFAGLEPGSYTLEIRGISNNGSLQTNVLRIQVNVAGPFYRSVWFFVLILLVLLLGGFLYVVATKKRRKVLQLKIEESTIQIREDKMKIEAQAAELRELDVAKSRFFANISHELRTPLALTLGPLQEILKDPTLPAKVKNQLLNIQSSSGQLRSLVEELLNLSRLDSGKLELSIESVEAHSWLNRIVMTWESYALSRQQSVVLDNRVVDHVTIRIDRDKTEKILNNLLSNALKFSPEESQVSVLTEYTDGFLNIQVTDSGPGIRPDEQEKIFGRFFQSQAHREHAEGGLGIGLHLSREMARLMKGSLEVKSIPGQGATFMLRIPAASQALDSATEKLTVVPLVTHEEMIPLNAEISTVNQATILVTEDHAQMRAFISQLLSSKYRVIEARNGAVAWDLLNNAETKIDLLISDVMMPEMNGFELLEKVKTHERLCFLPVIMLTARSGKEDRLRALRIGVDDYIAKPFDNDELLARVASLLENLRQRQAALAAAPEIEMEENGAQPENETDIPKEPSTRDLQWLLKAESIILGHLRDTRLGVEFLADQLSVSDRTLRRKINVLTGLNARDYIQEVRLQKARELLESGGCDSVKEASILVGYQNPEYFSEVFAKKFGVSPSKMLV